MQDKEILKLAGELLVAMYTHGGPIRSGVDNCAALAVLQARALARAIGKTDAELDKPAPIPQAPRAA